MPDSSHKLLEDISLSQIPSLPPVLERLLELCAGEEASLDELAALIDKDVALSARVIAVANSPAYYRRTPYVSLKWALITLGYRTVRAIAFTAALYQYFSESRCFDQSELRRFWRHVLATAVGARRLAALSKAADPDEAWLAGLMHDIGKMALAVNAPEEWAALRNEKVDPNARAELEHSRIGISHAAIGADTLMRWGLPAFVADAARFHHASLDTLWDAHPLVRAVCLANVIARPDGEFSMEHAVRAAGLFGLSGGVVAGLRSEVKGEVAEIEKMLGISSEIRLPPARDEDPLGARLLQAALLDAVAAPAGGDGDETSFVTAALTSVAILFDARSALLFEYDAADNRLRACPGAGQDARLRELELPLSDGRSLLAQSLLTRAAAQAGVDAGQSVLDRQIAGLLGGSVLMCLPLVAGERAVGVLVLGLREGLAERLLRQSTLLSGLAHDLARRWDTLRLDRDLRRTQINDLNILHNAQIRRAVHEINNPLTIVRNYLAILGDRLGSGHEAQEELQIIREEIDRVADLVLRLPDGEDESSHGAGATDINALVRDLSRLLEGSLLIGRAGIRIDLDLDEGLPVLHTARNTLKQILLNLGKNAIEALDGGGTLRFSTQDYVYLDGAPHVSIEVADDGPGIPPQILANLFQPVTSTKGSRHSGLGLSIVRNLVDALGGRINCRSTPATGTVFQIFLPREPA